MDHRVLPYHKFLLESIQFIENKDSLPQMESYDIVWDGKTVGIMDLSYLNTELRPDEIELAYLAIKPDYRNRGLSLGSRALAQIWQAFPQVNHIYLQAIPSAVGFWRKMGARDSTWRENYQVITRNK